MSGKTTADGHDVNNRRSLPPWSKRPEGELRSTREFLDTVIESPPVPFRTANPIEMYGLAHRSRRRCKDRRHEAAKA